MVKTKANKKKATEKGSSPSGSTTIDTPELRRSTRGTPSKKEITPLRKSTRLEKLAPVTSPLKSKPVVVVSKSTPLRRSDRGKKQENSSSSSGLKKLENESNSSNDKKTKGRLRRTVRRLMVESPEVSRSNKTDSRVVGSKRKRISVAGDDKADESDKSSQDESSENSGKEISEQDGEESSWKKSESTTNDSVEEQPHNSCEERSHKSSEEQSHKSSEEQSHKSSEERSHKSSEERSHNTSEVRSHDSSEEQSSESSKKYGEPNVSSDPDSKNSEKGDKLVDSTWVEMSTCCTISAQIPQKLYTRKRCKIACDKTQEDAKRLKFTTESNSNSTDAERSDIPRDSSQEGDAQINNNTTLSNGDLPSSPICKVKSPVKFSRWKDKEIQVLDDSSGNSEDEKDGENQKKMEATHSNSGSKKNGVEEGENSGVETDILNPDDNSSKPVANSLIAEVCIIVPEEMTTMSVEQTSFKFLLKRKIFRLSELLTLEEELQAVAISFLDYVIENHHVNKEPGTILQAFVISLCWIAASLVKKKIDKKESISLARKHLGYTCVEEEVESVYSKLRLLKKKYRQKIQVRSDVSTIEKLTSGIKSRQHGKIHEHDEVATLVVEKELVTTVNSTDLSKSEGQLSEVPDKTSNIGVDKPDSTTNKNDDVTSTINCTSPSPEPLPLPSDNAETDESNYAGQTSSNIADMADSQLPPCTEPPPVPLTGGQTPPQNADVAASQLAEGPSVIISQDVLQTGENQEVVESQPITQPVVGPTEPVGTVPVSNAESAAETRNPESSENRVNRAVGPTQGLSHSFPLFMESQLTSRILTLPLYSDPLQNDIDNMRRVKDQAAKAHEDCKSRIKYECEKEIGEIVAQIRRKHEDRLREADALFLSNKEKFEMHYNKVCMNRLLSHAFRVKCVGPSTDGLFFDDNVPGSNLMQQQSHVNSSFPPPVTTTSSIRQQTMLPPPVTIASSVRHQAVPPSTATATSSVRHQLSPPPVTAMSSVRHQALTLPPATVTSSVRHQTMPLPSPVTATLSVRHQTMPLPSPVTTAASSVRHQAVPPSTATATSSVRRQTMLSPPPVTAMSSVRHQALTLPPATVTSSVRHQTMPLPSPVTTASSVRHQMPAVTITPSVRHQTMPSPSPPITATSSVSRQTIPPPGFPQRSAPHLSSTPTRPLNINNITPATRIHHSTAAETVTIAFPGEFRSPAPHLQRSRPPSNSAAGLPPLNRISPGNQSSSQPLFQPLQSLTDESGNSIKSLPSKLQLLFDMDKISPANRPNLFPLLDPTTFSSPVTGTASKQVSSSSTDVVCLSDED